MTKARDWWSHAACRDADTEVFFNARDTRPALALCNACPVQPQCLDTAMAFEAAERIQFARHGVWGGLVPNQREALARGELNHPGMWCLTCARRFFAASTRAAYCSPLCAQRAAYARERLREMGVQNCGAAVPWYHPEQQKAPSGVRTTLGACLGRSASRTDRDGVNPSPPEG